jgi:hypothetical protein
VRFLSIAVVAMMLSSNSLAADTPQPEEGFVSLFDGKTLDGWKVGENADQFQVRDGVIVMECPATARGPAHLFYVGEVAEHSFKNFHLKVDVMTFPKANSGIYFHTKYQEAGWPDFGLECQVDNSHVDWRTEAPSKDNKEIVTILEKPPVKDNVWYTQEVIYRDGAITVKLDGKTMFEYKLPHADAEHKLPTDRTWLPRGTFALQGHPPLPGQMSKACFKNIRVKVLPD